MPELNDASRGTTPATLTGSTRVGSRSFRDAAAQARAILASQETQRRERRAQRWAELAEQLLRQQHADGVAVVSEERLFVLSYNIIKGPRVSALTTAESVALRQVTRRVWLAQDPGETQVAPGGMMEAATAEAASVSNSPDGRGSTVVVSATPDGGERSSSPAPATDGEYLALAVSLSRAQFRTLEPLTPVDGEARS